MQRLVGYNTTVELRSTNATGPLCDVRVIVAICPPAARYETAQARPPIQNRGLGRVARFGNAVTVSLDG